MTTPSIGGSASRSTPGATQRRGATPSVGDADALQTGGRGGGAEEGRRGGGVLCGECARVDRGAVVMVEQAPAKKSAKAMQLPGGPRILEAAPGAVVARRHELS